MIYDVSYMIYHVSYIIISYASIFLKPTKQDYVRIIFALILSASLPSSDG